MERLLTWWLVMVGDDTVRAGVLVREPNKQERTEDVTLSKSGDLANSVSEDRILAALEAKGHPGVVAFVKPVVPESPEVAEARARNEAAAAALQRREAAASGTPTTASGSGNGSVTTGG